MSVFKDTRTLVARTVAMVKEISEGKEVTINDTTRYYNGVTYLSGYLCDPVFVDTSTISTRESVDDILINSGYYMADMLT